MAGSPADPLPGNSTTNTGAFLSATSNQEPQGADGNTPHAPANPPLQNRRVKVRRDEFGINYLIDPATGVQYDVSDDEDLSLHTPPPQGSPFLGRTSSQTISDASDISGSPQVQGAGSPEFNSETLLEEFTRNLNPGSLTNAQRSQFNTLRGMLTMGRQSLLSTTSLVAGQRVALQQSATALHEFRNDVAARFEDMNHSIVNNQERVDETLDNNVRILRAFGSTDQQLSTLIAAIAGFSPSPTISLPTLPTVAPATEDALGTLRPEYHRRGIANVRRRERSASSFAPAGFHDVPPHLAPAIKSARFAPIITDNSSISTPGPHAMGHQSVRPRNAPPPVAPMESEDVFEAFAAEKSNKIRGIVGRHLAHSLEGIPSYVRIPKLDNPPKYKGENDDVLLMAWIGKVCAWMQANLLGGPSPTLVHLRVTILRNHLDGAHQATKDYKAVRYDPIGGIEMLVSELIRTATAMREPPPDFSIRQ
ncbi:hypothetical protein C8R44DRAFT_892991 [Mycena epipterygia]|nr:hypothetical protein C8R44DRAFT_892991 [Mycena epipterygia]